MSTKCPGHGRHWFTVRAKQAGSTGMRTPRCVRCGAPNPKSDLTSDDWMSLRAIKWSGLTDQETAWLDQMAEDGWPEGGP